MKKIYSILTMAAILLSFNNLKAQDLVLTAVGDGDLPGGLPKFVELYVINNVADLSIYGIGSDNNKTNGGSDGEEFTFPAVAGTAGQYIYIANDSAGFHTYFGFSADYESNAAGANGDDAYELFMNGTTVDIYGVIDLDGTGETWDFLDGWAYRNDGTGPDGNTYVDANWTVSVTAFDGFLTNAAATNPMPVGTYAVVSTPKINLTASAFTMNEGDPTTVATNIIVNPTNATAGSFEIHLIGGNGSAADLDLTAFGGGPFPLTIPVAPSATTLTVPITPIDDLVFEGTETFNFVLRNATGGISLGSDTTFVLTLTDNELPPDTTVAFNPITVTANEGDGTVDLTAVIGQLSVNGTTFTVDAQLTSGDPADLGGYTTQTISFSPTGTVSQALTVTITDDALVEGNEDFIFTLVNPSTGLTLGTNTTVTLTITDNDAPTYTIAQLSTVDANGDADSLGVLAELTATVMGINYGDLPNINFYIHDGTGGMGVFNATDLGYTVSEGDEIVLRGEVGFFNGLTQMVNLDTIFVTGTGTLPAVATVTSLGESTEGELVKLENVTVMDQTDWNTGVGTGFNVDVTDGTNTFSVRIDRSTDLFNLPLPGCVIDVTGIGSQFDNSSPYTSGYQLLPRYAADITVISPCVATQTTIADATEIDPATGDPLMFGSNVTLKGIITSPDFRELQPEGTEFTFSDGTGGIWAYTTDSSISFNPVVGDSVEVSGNIGAGSGVTRLFINTVTNLGPATPFMPTVVSSALGEAQEGELITINGLTLNGTWNSGGGSYNVSATANGVTYDIRVDADRAELFNVALGSNDVFNLTGVGSQFDPTAPRLDGYSIMPRFDSDVEIVSAIKDVELANFVVSPVPAANNLNFSFDYDNSETASVRLIDVVGKVNVATTINLVKGNNTNSITVSELSAGFYVLQIQTTKGVSITNVLVK